MLPDATNGLPRCHRAFARLPRIKCGKILPTGLAARNRATQGLTLGNFCISSFDRRASLRHLSGMTNPQRFQVYDRPMAAACGLADEVCSLIAEDRRRGNRTVLGLATGATPLPFYAELIRRHRDEGFSFANVTTFNLDEYLGLPREHPASYWTFMHENLFDHIDIPAEQIHLPDGMAAPEAVAESCRAYEQAILDAGGVDLQILGIGRTGHIGFNEPGSPRDSRTRIVHLDERTRSDNSAYFASLSEVPTHAVTMGCGTILDARRLRLMAWGKGKAGIVRESLTGPVTDRVSASFLQEHPDALFLLDRDAAGLL
jgi:glucosamine-6-phosphate deaminase